MVQRLANAPGEDRNTGDTPHVSTLDLQRPANAPGEDRNMFTAFCRTALTACSARQMRRARIATTPILATVAPSREQRPANAPGEDRNCGVFHERPLWSGQRPANAPGEDRNCNAGL